MIKVPFAKKGAFMRKVEWEIEGNGGKNSSHYYPHGLKSQNLIDNDSNSFEWFCLKRDTMIGFRSKACHARTVSNQGLMIIFDSKRDWWSTSFQTITPHHSTFLINAPFFAKGTFLIIPLFFGKRTFCDKKEFRKKDPFSIKVLLHEKNFFAVIPYCTCSVHWITGT
jgi:hypothetical protein